MGVVVPFERPAPSQEVRPKKEPDGHLLVPVRILKSLADFEASIDAVARDIPTEVATAVLACLEMSARYR
jgi:hypothetical protein